MQFSYLTILIIFLNINCFFSGEKPNTEEEVKLQNNKDLIIITGKITKVGEKSITMQVVAEKETKTERTVVVKAEFIFVAYDLVQKKAIPHVLGN